MRRQMRMPKMSGAPYIWDFVLRRPRLNARCEVAEVAVCGEVADFGEVAVLAKSLILAKSLCVAKSLVLAKSL